MSETVAAPAAPAAASTDSTQTQQGGEAAKPTEPDIASLLKGKPLTVKRRDGREERIDSVDRLNHLLSKGFGAETEISAARKAQEEARAYREREERLRKDPRGTLRELLGEQEFRQLAEQEALEAYENELKLKGVPAHVQKELMEAKALKQEAERLKAEKAQQQEQEQLRQREAEANAAREYMMDVGVRALQAVGFAEKPPVSTIMRMAPYLAEAMDMGVAEPEKTAALLLKEDMTKEFVNVAKSYVDAKDGAGLTAMLGDEVVKLLLRHRLTQNNKSPMNPTGAPQAVKPLPKQPEPEMSPAEMRAWMRGR